MYSFWCLFSFDAYVIVSQSLSHVWVFATPWTAAHQSSWITALSGEGTCVSQLSYEPCHAGPPKTDRSWWRVLTKRGPRVKTTPVFLLWEPHEQYEQAKRCLSFFFYFILKTITFSKSQAVLEWLDAFLHWLVFEFNALTLGVDFPWPLSSH